MSAFHCNSLNEFGEKTLQSFSEVREFLILVCLFLVKSLPFFNNAQKAFYINKEGLLSYKILKLWSYSFAIERLNILNFSIGRISYTHRY